MSLLLDLVGACLAGLAAGVLMTLFEIPFWKKWGMEGVAEWQVNAVMVCIREAESSGLAASEAADQVHSKGE